MQPIIITFLEHPAQLLVGNPSALATALHTFFKQRWCSNNSCNACTACKQIENHQHADFLWIEPATNSYTLETIAPLFNYINLQRAADQPFFFVLTQADCLTSSCANALLKSLEEPPAGYYFILLATQTSSIVPTILSRCLIQQFHHNEHSSAFAALFNTLANPADPLAFLSALEESKINEQEAIHLANALLNYWHKQYKQALLENKQHESAHIKDKIDRIAELLLLSPMPGSSKIFLKNLFLQLT
jgi:DNA polymerase III delta prime subunit